MANRKKIPTIEFGMYKDLTKYVSESRVNILNDVVTSIEYAISNKKDIAKPFAIKCDEDIAIIEMGIPQFQWKSTLNYIHSYMIKHEQYEYIPKINKLKTKISPITNKPKIKVTLQ